jgi:hypothetical protein
MTVSDARQFAPATQRNRDPILQFLSSCLPDEARVLEIASGTGEHGLYFSENLPVVWQPSDVNPLAIASIKAWQAEQGNPKFLDPLEIDVNLPSWWDAIAGLSFNVLVNINMIHISPWTSAVGLFQGASAILPKGGVFYLYGPFKQKGIHTSQSNVEFDQSLRARDSSWGVRNLEDVIQLGVDYGVSFQAAIAMPANNLSLWFIH